MDKEKQYVVVCFGKNDAIHTMQQVYLRMKIDFKEKYLTFSTGNRTIYSDHALIRFVTRTELRHCDGLRIYGIQTTKRFDEFGTRKQKDDAEKLKIRSSGYFGRNDRDGLLKFYLKRGA